MQRRPSEHPSSSLLRIPKKKKSPDKDESDAAPLRVVKNDIPRTNNRVDMHGVVDRMQQNFSGHVYDELQELGVQAFNANELENTVMAQADVMLELQRCQHETKRTKYQIQQERKKLREVCTIIAINLIQYPVMVSNEFTLLFFLACRLKML